MIIRYWGLCSVPCTLVVGPLTITRTTFAAQVVCNRCSLSRVRLHKRQDADKASTPQSDRVRVCDYCHTDMEEEQQQQDTPTAGGRDGASTPIMHQLREQIQRNSTGSVTDGSCMYGEVCTVPSLERFHLQISIGRAAPDARRRGR